MGASSRPRFSHRQSYMLLYIHIRPNRVDFEGGGCTKRPSYITTRFPGPLRNIKNRPFSETVVARVRSVHKSDVFTPRRVRKTFLKKNTFQRRRPFCPPQNALEREKKTRFIHPYVVMYILLYCYFCIICDTQTFTT